MENIFARNEMYWGEKAQAKLKTKHVIVFGLGGVGGHAAETLARAGIGEITLVDCDTVEPSNINRQIIATTATIGMPKTEACSKRLKDINPKIKINVINEFYSEEKNELFFKTMPDFVIEAIDTMKSKISLLWYCFQHKIKVISCLGVGNRMDPTKLFLNKYSQLPPLKCPFVKKFNEIVTKFYKPLEFFTIYSTEVPKKPAITALSKFKINQKEDCEITKISPSSTPFVPTVAGVLMGFWVVNEILG